MGAMTAAMPPVRVSREERLLRLFGRAGVLLYLVVLVGAFAVAAPGFFSEPTLLAMINIATPLMVVSAAMTVCLVGAEVDLSVGGIVGLSSTITALTLLWGWPWPFAVVTAVVAGGIVGMLNGLLTARLVNIVPLFPSFLPTLGVFWLTIGVAEAFLPSQQAISINNDSFAGLFSGYLPAIYAIGTVVFVHLVLTRTSFGYRVFAVGSNRRAAALAGIDVTRTKFLTLVASGLLTGLGGVLMAGYFQGGYSQIARGIELDAIGAAVIGGTALFGGRGSALASLSGVLVLSVLDTGLLLMQVPPAIQLAAKGVIVIVAVAANTYVRRRLSSR